MKEKLKALALASWTPSEKILLVADVFLAGILVGWLTSPLTKYSKNFPTSIGDEMNCKQEN